MDNFDNTLQYNEGWLQYNDNYPTSNGEGNGSEIRAQIIINSFFITRQTAGAIISFLTLTPLVNGIRNYIAITIDLEKGIAQGYLNGNVFGKATSSASILTTPYNSLFELFNLFASTTQNVYATGLTDEFRIYSETLSDSDIIQSWNNGCRSYPLRTDKLIVWYKFE
ncbi:LamG-like jellyroll fold domain-containing protein [Mucilaginibacter sp.]